MLHTTYLHLPSQCWLSTGSDAGICVCANMKKYWSVIDYTLGISAVHSFL